MRAQEISAEASNSILEDDVRSITNGVDIDVATTEGGPTTDVAVSGKPNPPTY